MTTTNFTFNWLPAAGTLMILAGIITALILRVGRARRCAPTARRTSSCSSAIITVMAVLALAYVMNLSGQTGSLGAWLAGAGSAFAILSPIIGWLGVAVTGSDTSPNALFGALQVQTAGSAGLDQVLMAAPNSSGGVLGKMVSPQNLAIAAAAVGLAGKEGDIFRKVAKTNPDKIWFEQPYVEKKTRAKVMGRARMAVDLIREGDTEELTKRVKATLGRK